MSRVPGTVSGASKVDPAFPLGVSLSFTDSATGVPVLFARFAGTMETSDSRGTYMSGFGIGLPRPSPVAIRRGNPVGLPVLAHGVSTHARGLRLRGVKERLASIVALHVAFPLSGQGRHAEGLISELDNRPACTPTNASAATSRSPPHSSGPGWFARPFPYDSFIRNSMPVYPGAFPDPVDR